MFQDVGGARGDAEAVFTADEMLDGIYTAHPKQVTYVADDRRCLVVKNLVPGKVGIATGGYCNGGEACGGEQTGAAHDNRFVRNVLRANNQLDDGSPEVLVQYHAYRNSFEHNVVWATNDARAVVGTVAGAEDDGSTPLRADHNTYWTTGGHRRQATFGSLGTTYTGFDTYRKATGQDRHSRFAKFTVPRR